MAYDDFVRALARRQNIPYEQLKGKKTFALNTNNRGENLVHHMKRLGFDFQGKNVVDIGCAYGGMSIEPARAGANVIGVDVSDDLLDLARANAKGDVKVDFKRCDASSVEFDSLVPSGWADLIIVHDVFEHIYDTAGLLANLSRVARQGCFLYFVVPNGRSARFVLSEGHKSYPAISLVDPDCWHYFLPGRHRIFYRRWPYFESLFRHYGFADYLDFTKYPVADDQIHEHVTAITKDIEKLLTHDFGRKEANEIAQEEISKYLAELRRDAKSMTTLSFKHGYAADFWYGIRRKA